MDDFEKLGAFYLGRGYDVAAGRRREDLVLYDARDLTTHAVIIGMTGSGKTGLGVALIEEAAIDGVPVIAVDPKGDLGNLLLTFPDLRASDFRPWIDPQAAATAGMTEDAFAAAQADAWRVGLSEWGQTPERIRRLREAAEFALYTPGSTAAAPLSLLRAFAAPPADVRADGELYRERIEAAVTGLLALLGIQADPLTSREHILLANILSHHWDAGRDVDLPALVAAAQAPPFERLGVLPLESVFPARERATLAMRLNNLLAAPGFQDWLAGEPLDAARLLHTDSGKPRVSVISIAHLGEAERMFFLTLLLTEILAWLRAQPGTSSLRAILYIDEVFGYLPPVAEPPTKKPLLTLLKQARAYGLGVVLATQNPVDLDYKALANAGTWLIGRLQTEQDKARVLEGLLAAGGGAAGRGGGGGGARVDSAGSGGALERTELERILGSLGKRVFFMHDVHEDAPVVFESRWALSYLAGPMTREQIKRLSTERAAAPAQPVSPVASGPGPAGVPFQPAETGSVSRADRPAKPSDAPTPTGAFADRQPILAPEVPQFFLPVEVGVTAVAGTEPPASIVYRPFAFGMGEITYASAKHGVGHQKRFVRLAPIGEGPVPVDWEQSEVVEIDAGALTRVPLPHARFAPCPAAAGKAKVVAAWSASLGRWLRSGEALMLWRSLSLKLTSNPGESERDFRIRLQQAARERRDAQVDALRRKYAMKITTLTDRVRRAEQAVSREAEQVKQRQLDTAVSFGTAIFGAVLGRKAFSSTSASRAGTAMRSAGRVRKEQADVARASENVEALRAQLAALEGELSLQVAQIEAASDVQGEVLEEIVIRPKAADVHVELVGVAWVGSLSNRQELR